jgi:hypothetical protein
MLPINKISVELVLIYYDPLHKIILDQVLHHFESTLKIHFRIKFQSLKNIKSINLNQELLTAICDAYKSVKNKLFLTIYKKFEEILMNDNTEEALNRIIEYDLLNSYVCYYYFPEKINEDIVKLAFSNEPKKYNRVFFVLFLKLNFNIFIQIKSIESKFSNFKNVKIFS